MNVIFKFNGKILLKTDIELIFDQKLELNSIISIKGVKYRIVKKEYKSIKSEEIVDLVEYVC